MPNAEETEAKNLPAKFLQRYIYREYLQIACIDLTRSHHPCLWLLTWDPSEPVATRPLAIQISGTWYTYGWDLTKNICELYGTTGYISTTYTYTPFGQVTASGSVTQPIQWSSEVWDEETGLAYYNWRYYNAMVGRWISRDFIESDISEICFVQNCPIVASDELGLLKMHLLTGKENLFNDTRIDGAFNMHWQFEFIAVP